MSLFDALELEINDAEHKCTIICPLPRIFDYRFSAASGNTKLRVVAFTLTPKISAVQNVFRFPLFPDRNPISLNSHVS